MYYALSTKGNRKTGPIPMTTSSAVTCPSACPMIEKGCYAKYSFLGMYWKKLTAGNVKASMSWNELLQSIKRLPKGQLWRHNQAGDLVHNNQVIDGKALGALVAANKGKRGFTYTHHDMTIGTNEIAVTYANEMGFTVNLSGNNTAHADELIDMDIGPVVSLMPMDSPKVSYTPAGRKVVICPAEGSDKVTCATCALCALPDRDYVIGFRAHGTGKKKVDLIASSG